METGRGHNHSFGVSTNFVPGHIAEMLQHDRCFLRNIMGVERFKLPDCTHTSRRIQFRIIRDGLGDLIVHPVGHVVLQDIQDEVLFNGLTHRVNVEGMILAVGIPLAEHLERLILGGCRKGKEREIFLGALGRQLIQKLVLIILPGFFRCGFFGGVFLQNFIGVCQCPLEFAGSIAGLGRMGLIHNDGKPLIPGTHFLVNHRELLQSCDDNACSVVDGIP